MTKKEDNNLNNVICPFCGKPADKESVQRLSLRNINAVVLPLLLKQGLEIRKIRKDKLKQNENRKRQN